MTDLNSYTILYKVLTPDEFNALLAVAPSTPFTDPSSASLSICTSSRLPYVLETLFASTTDLWVLAIPRNERINPLLRWQDGEGCGQVEGGVDPWGEVALRRPVKRTPDGQWDLGELEWEQLLGWGVTTGAGIASYPLDTIRRRMMMTSGEKVHYNGMLDAGRQIVKAEGVASLFKGAGAIILRGVAGAGVLSMYDKLQELLFGKVYSGGSA